MPKPADFMRRATVLSKNGYPAPNPRVGAVVVKDGEVIGEGYHSHSGGPHAEVVALEQAGEKANGADLYVTLEPCAHHGKTPPCTNAIIEAGIKRVYYAVADPNTVASGGGNAVKAAGIHVGAGLLENEAAEVNRIFLHRYRTGVPYVLVKAAITLDGRIATKSGESKWITDGVARARAHQLRAEYGCILIGSKTAELDNPELTYRPEQMAMMLEVEKNAGTPVFLGTRVVLDLDRRLDDSLRVFWDGRLRTLRVVSPEYAVEGDFMCPLVNDEFDLDSLLRELAKREVIGVLVEGGGVTIESFFRQSVVNEVELHVAPKVFGSGRVWADGPGVESITDAWQLRDLKCEPLSDGLRINAKVKR